MTMFECDSCATEVRFVDANGDGVTCGCADGNPQERAAIALFDDFKHSIGWPSKTWDDEALDDTDGRETFRHKARLALAAAINVEELADMITTYKEDPDGNLLLQTRHEIAHTVAVHFLGSENVQQSA